MNQYLTDTEFAVRGLFDLIGKDELTLCDRQSDLDSALTRLTTARAILHNGAPPTGFGEDSTPFFEKKAREARREIEDLRGNITALELAIFAKETSVQVVASAILQVAKQGISIVRGSLTNAPPGRSIGREVLKNVIWQARNQSMHWEENFFKAPVIKCFANLRLDFGADYEISQSQPGSLAKQILHLLAWTDYASYERDMVTLLG